MHPRRTRPLLATAVALLATALAPVVTGPGPAHAEQQPKPQPRTHPPTAAQPQPGNPGLLLTVSGSAGTWIRGVRLHCTPEPGGRHPKPVEACAALDAAEGDLDDLAGQPAPCTLEHDPVTASATGTHRGRPVDWHHTYANLCVFKAHTGPVFDF
ncbi:SSI family serine proteinase inhibitor [Streptomyces sp. Da 82-17]|uniref:SSI family serine proteinase inhibitor n=1 Tax=Streptomyces sp. Da 82-17 TaxID=3377116 RepID=UPI0038D36BD3